MHHTSSSWSWESYGLSIVWVQVHAQKIKIPTLLLCELIRKDGNGNLFLSFFKLQFITDMTEEVYIKHESAGFPELFSQILVRQHIACLWGPSRGCLLWVQSLAHFTNLPMSCFMWNHVKPCYKGNELYYMYSPIPIPNPVHSFHWYYSNKRHITNF